MQTLITLFIFFLTYGLISRLIGIPILNLIGLPGALIGYKSKSKNEIRFVVGVMVSAIGHIYFYSAFMIYVIEWTRLRVIDSGISKYVIWFFCMVAVVGPIQKLYQTAKNEATEFPTGFENPQIQSLLVTEVISFFSFLLFAFYPESIEPIWSWVLKIGYPFQT